MNDLVDIESDSLHDVKKDRAIGSGKISKREGWMYSGILLAISLMLGRSFVGYSFTWWLAGNIGIMLFMLLVSKTYFSRRMYYVDGLLYLHFWEHRLWWYRHG